MPLRLPSHQGLLSSLLQQIPSFRKPKEGAPGPQTLTTHSAKVERAGMRDIERRGVVKISFHGQPVSLGAQFYPNESNLSQSKRPLTLKAIWLPDRYTITGCHVQTGSLLSQTTRSDSCAGKLTKVARGEPDQGLHWYQVKS
jgi:hypothetical protein